MIQACVVVCTCNVFGAVICSLILWFRDIGWLRDYFTELCQELRSKDAERAAHHKEEGNKLFLAGRDQQALLTYTQVGSK